MERNANAYYDLVAATVELMNERIQCDEITMLDDESFYDALHEVVDGQVPHYYSEIFTVMAADGIDRVHSRTRRAVVPARDAAAAVRDVHL